MAQKLFPSPDARPIQDPSGSANGLTRYTNMRRWVEQTQADKGEIFIYEDFARPFNCIAAASGETKSAANSLRTGAWIATADGTHTESCALAFTNVADQGRLTVTTNDTDLDMVHVEYAMDPAVVDRPWSFEVGIAAVAQATTFMGAGVGTTGTGKTATGQGNNTAYFWRSENTVWNCETRTGGSANDATALAAGYNAVNNAFQSLGLDYDGVGTVKFYIDESLVATHSWVPGNPMRPFFEVKAGASGGKVIYLSHVALFVGA
jgi:hypothetical protein